MRNRQETSCLLGVGATCATPTPEVALLAGDKDGRAFLRYSSKLELPMSATTWTADLTVPFDKEENEGVLGDLSGVNGDLALGTEINLTRWHPFDVEAYATALCRACEDAGISTLIECNRVSLIKRARELRSKARESEEQARIPARTIRKNDRISERKSQRRDLVINDAGFAFAVGGSWVAKASVGGEEREFFEVDGGVETDDRLGFAVGASRLWLLKNGQLGIGLIGKRDYEEAKVATFCTAIEDTMLQDCKTKPRSRATEEESLIANTEGKLLFHRWALAARIEHDFEDSTWGIEAPVYLVRIDKGALTGGVRVGWLSEVEDDEENWSVAIFISKPLGFGG